MRVLPLFTDTNWTDNCLLKRRREFVSANPDVAIVQLVALEEVSDVVDQCAQSLEILEADCVRLVGALVACVCLVVITVALLTALLGGE